MRSLLRGAWHTVVPGPGDRHGPLPPMLLGLTVLSGVIDAVSYLTMDHVFVANQTGNVAFLAFALTGAPGFSIAASVIALAFFAVGSFVGGRLVRTVGHRSRALLRGALVETALLGAATAVVAVDSAPGPLHAHPYRYLAIALTALAMGVQNAVVQVLAVPDLTTNVMTKTIAGLFTDSAVGGRLEERAGRQVLSVLALAVGAVLGAALVLHTNATAAVATAAALAVAVGLAAARYARSTAPWTGSP
ncbi:YoaK family protein [Kitasatospora nipponensis]|uniref:YoaK family protein n=1 Tax=Kitasatospora nipponensis TaxID=258049 RepID=A0ABP4HLB3_9ACTN